MKDCLVAHSTWQSLLLARRANSFWWRASSEGSINVCVEISEMTIKLQVLNSSGRLLISITQLNEKSTVSLSPDIGQD